MLMFHPTCAVAISFLLSCLPPFSCLHAQDIFAAGAIFAYEKQKEFIKKIQKHFTLTTNVSHAYKVGKNLGGSVSTTNVFKFSRAAIRLLN